MLLQYLPYCFCNFQHSQHGISQVFLFLVNLNYKLKGYAHVSKDVIQYFQCNLTMYCRYITVQIFCKPFNISFQSFYCQIVKHWSKKKSFVIVSAFSMLPRSIENENVSHLISSFLYAWIENLFSRKTVLLIVEN